jgi:hypothetical protein
MTFNPSGKKKDNFKSTPLIEDSQDQFVLLQNNFLEFIKLYDEISDYEKKLDTLTRKEYDKIKDDMYLIYFTNF